MQETRVAISSSIAVTSSLPTTPKEDINIPQPKRTEEKRRDISHIASPPQDDLVSVSVLTSAQLVCILIPPYVLLFYLISIYRTPM